MQELENSNNNYTVAKDKETMIINTNEPVHLNSVFYDQKHQNLLISAKKYRANGTYDTDYIFLNNQMDIVKCLSEQEGVMPEFLSAPDKSVWVRLSSTSTDKVKEIFLPLENRTRIQKEILLPEFVNSDTIRFNDEYILFFGDLFNSKNPDKLCRIIFDKNNLFKSRKVFKLPLPSKTKMIASENSLHAINAIRPNSILHREFDLEFNEIRKREFSLGVNRMLGQAKKFLAIF